MMLSGTGALVRKELINLLREPKSASMIFFPIVMFLTLFVFASTKDIANSSLVIYNQDSGMYSRNLLGDLVSTDIFKETLYVKSEKEMAKAIDTEKAFIGVVFPQDFSKNIMGKKRADVQVVTDGRRTNAAAITYGYFSNVMSRFQRKLSGSTMPEISVRTWYNPDKNQIWFSITNIICMIIISQAISLTSLSLAREKEQGTFDQLLVSPIKPLGIIIGKITPSIIISFFMGMAVLVLGSLFFGVPVRGSMWLLTLSMLVYTVSVVGIGVFIAAFANTQQQAMLGTFLIQMPMMTLSGLTAPVQSIKLPLLKAFVKCNPVVYANKLVSGLMIKDISLQSVLRNVYPLLLIAVVLLFASFVVFAKKYKLKMF